MSFIDSGITAAVGFLLVLRPQAFTKRSGPEAEPLRQRLRRIGFVLIGVAVLLAIATLGRS